ncbi:hypothetical protein PMAYCL1PPCAC_19435, partial [Pristionchus mayeri]
ACLRCGDQLDDTLQLLVSIERSASPVASGDRPSGRVPLRQHEACVCLGDLPRDVSALVLVLRSIKLDRVDGYQIRAGSSESISWLIPSQFHGHVTERGGVPAVRAVLLRAL